MGYPEMSTHQVVEEIGAFGENYQWAARLLIQAFARSGIQSLGKDYPPDPQITVNTLIRRLSSKEIKLFNKTIKSLRQNPEALRLLAYFVNEHHRQYGTVEALDATRIGNILGYLVEDIESICYPS